MDWATWVDGHKRVTPMEGAMGSICLGDPRVDRVPSHPIYSHHTTNQILYRSQILISIGPSEISWILTAGLYDIFSTSSYGPRGSTTHFHRFRLECQERCGRVLTMGSFPSSSAASPQMEPKLGFWFGKLSMEWWERDPQANTAKYGEKNWMSNTNPASRVNAERSNNILRDAPNNVG